MKRKDCPYRKDEYELPSGNVERNVQFLHFKVTSSGWRSGSPN
jgi:hypothetical protein